MEARESEAERQEREGIEESQELQRFDWVTETDTLISPVPNASDFHPTMPSQPIRTPPKPSVTPPNGDEASNTVGVTLAKAIPVDAAPVLHKHKPQPK